MGSRAQERQGDVPGPGVNGKDMKLPVSYEPGSFYYLQSPHFLTSLPGTRSIDAL